MLEGTELYAELQNAVVEYAKTKGDYQGRLDALTELYKGVEGADINAELTADLVGDYLFTDADFLNNLSAKHRNVFQKIYDEVKYLCKIATAGSKEARQLEKVKKAFEDAFRAETKNTAQDGGVKYSIEYENAEVNNRILELANKIESGEEYSDNDYVELGTVSQEQADLIYNLVKKDLKGYKVRIEARQIRHIINDHGKNGGTDHSMSDNNDIAKLEFALHNFNDIRHKDKTNAYWHNSNGYNRTADTVLYECEKAIGDKSYYVVETAVDTKAKTLYIVSAFIGDAGYKKGTDSQLIDAKSPNATPKSVADTVPIDSISQNSEKSTENAKKSLSAQNDDLGPIGDYNVYGKDVALKEAYPDDYAPIGETPNSQTSVDTENGEVNRVDTEGATVLSTESTTDDKPIQTVKDKLEARLGNLNTELDNVRQKQAERVESLDERIADLQAQYDGKSNKDTKIANKLLRNIERLKRIRADIVADYGKRVSDIESRINRVNDELQKDHSKADRLERAYAKIDRQLEQDKAELRAQYESRKAEAQKTLG